MKKILNQYKWILLIGCFIFSTVLGIYFYTFRHYGLSDATGVWGSFGSYLGGVLAPILSFTSIILIIYSINQQKNNNDRQKFETTFFKLIELHKNEIYNLEIKKKDLHKYEANNHMNETISSYEVLNELLETEEKNTSEYYYIQMYKKNNVENLYVYNYRALNNHFIQTRDFLNSIIYDTVYILKLINEAEISAKEKTFYKRILKSKLRDTEKFFLVVFYIQIHNSIKDYITREELVELAGPKEWILKPLYLSDNFPFCIPGMCFGNSFDIDIPQVHYHSTLANFLKADFFYLVKLIKNLDTQCSKMLIQINEDSGNKFEVPLIDIEFRNRIWHFNLKSFLKKYFSNGADLTTIQPITFFTGAQPYLENHRTFFLHIEIQMILNNDTYTILDKIMFQLNANGEIFININSTKNTAWDWNWRAWSFREDNPA